MIHVKLKKLLEKKALYNHKNGSLNVTAVAKNAGVHQATLQRILDGRSKEPRIEIIQKVCNASGIKMSDVYGVDINVSVTETLSKQEKQILAIFNGLSAKGKKLAVKILSVIE